MLFREHMQGGARGVCVWAGVTGVIKAPAFPLQTLLVSKNHGAGEFSDFNQLFAA